MKPVQLGPFLGLNTRLEDFALNTKEGAYLSAASNVYLDKAGRVHRRPGLTLIQAMTGAHSLFKNYLVRGAALYRITLPTYSETLIKVLASDDAMSYAEHDGSIYYSNGTDSGRIGSDGALYPWVLPTPSAPATSNIAGTLPAGKYLVAVGYANTTTGEEGGLSASAVVTLSAAGAIRVTLPAATTGATHVKVYVSKHNGTALGLYSTVATGTATVDITSTTTGKTGQDKYIEPMPACTNLFIHMGRLCGTKGDTLYYSEPYRMGYYRADKGFIRFESAISVAVPNQSGVYVVTDKTQWIPGDVATPADMIRDVRNYGAVPGTVFSFPTITLVGWVGDKGFVIGDDQGQVTSPTEDVIDFDPPASGTAYVMELAKERLVVSCGYCMNLETKSVTRWEGYALNSLSEGYGIAPVGLLSLAGDTDNGSEISSVIGIGKQNFKTEELKYLIACYVGVASPEKMAVTVTLPDEREYTYATRGSDAALKMQRFDLGRGLRASWFGLTLSNTNGADFTLASASIEAKASTRRI